MLCVRRATVDTCARTLSFAFKPRSINGAIYNPILYSAHLYPPLMPSLDAHPHSSYSVMNDVKGFLRFFSQTSSSFCASILFILYINNIPKRAQGALKTTHSRRAAATIPIRPSLFFLFFFLLKVVSTMATKVLLLLLFL